VPYRELAEPFGPHCDADSRVATRSSGNAASRGIRVAAVPVWLHEPLAGMRTGERRSVRCPFPQSFILNLRRNRGPACNRDEDELSLSANKRIARPTSWFLATAADDLGLYGKPMARNSLDLTQHFERLLDGPLGKRPELSRAAEHLAEGGLVRYRFFVLVPRCVSKLQRRSNWQHRCGLLTLGRRPPIVLA